LAPLARVSVDKDTKEKVSDQNMPGPEVHLNIIAAAAAGELLREISPNGAAWLTGVAAFLAWLLALIMRQPFRRVLLSAVVGTVFWFYAQWLFDHGNYVVALVSPLLAFGSTTLGTFTYDFVLERREKN